MAHTQPPTPAHIDGQSARGVTMFAIAMLAVPAFDAIAKILGQSLAPAFIAFMRYSVQSAILVVVIVVVLRRPLFAGTRAFIPSLALAGAFAAVCIGSLFTALQFLPLANTIAIFFVEPLILTMFSAWFLGEKVGWHRTGAVLVGLAGALVIIRPNLALYGWATLLPLVTAVGFAAIMTIFRKLSPRLDSLRIQTISGAFAALFLGVLSLAGHAFGPTTMALVAPSADQWAILVGMGVFATLAQMLITMSVKYAEASLVAPFQYLEIVGATALGYLLFDEFPDALTWTGTAIILAAGFYIIHRERTLSRARLAVGAPN